VLIAQFLPYFNLCVLLWLGIELRAQSNDEKIQLKEKVFDQPSLSLNVHGGKLIKIHGEYPENKLSTGLELHISFSLNPRMKWVENRGYPALGASFIRIDFGNREVLGTALGFVPMLEYISVQTRLYFRAGMGVARFTRPFDAIDRPDNLVIGSRYANLTMAALGWRFVLGNNSEARLGISFMHMSNAHIRVPNIGGNIIALNAAYRFGKKKAISSIPAVISVQEKWVGSDTVIEKSRIKWRPGLHLIAGLHSFPGTVRPIGGPLYSVFGLSIYMVQKDGMNKPWSSGINYHFYPAYHNYIISQELFPAKEAIKNSHHLVAFIGRSYYFGRFSLFYQLGYNLYAPFLREMNEVWDLPKKGFLYTHTSNKIGYRYSPPIKGLLLGVAVKSSGGTADFLEFQLGYEF